MILRLEVSDVLEINAGLCADTRENSACLDPGELEAAVQRPWSGFGDDEFYPTLCEKAAALLHAIASRQVFENGNKRTAWVAATTFLEVNGVDIGRVETSHADMFVRAAALDHTLEILDIAEWFESALAGRRPGAAQHPKAEFLYLATSGQQGEDGTVSVLQAGMAGVTTNRFPLLLPLCIVTRLHWRDDDANAGHTVQVSMRHEDSQLGAVDEIGPWWVSTAAPTRSGHAHHREGWMPSLVIVNPYAVFEHEGIHWFDVTLDGEPLGSLSFNVALTDAEPAVGLLLGE